MRSKISTKLPCPESFAGAPYYVGFPRDLVRRIHCFTKRKALFDKKYGTAPEILALGELAFEKVRIPCLLLVSSTEVSERTEREYSEERRRLIVMLGSLVIK